MHLWYYAYTGPTADTDPFPYGVTSATSGEGIGDYISQDTMELHLFLV